MFSHTKRGTDREADESVMRNKTPVSSRGKWLLVTILLKPLINLNTNNSNGVEGPQNGGYHRISQVKFEAVYSIPTN